MKKLFLSVLLLSALFLLGVLPLGLDVHLANVGGTVCIRSDGSVDPARADTGDNTCDGLLTVTILGSINGDDKVDMADAHYAI